MSLAALYNVPAGALELQLWSFHNASEHLLIANAISVKKSKRIVLPPLDPIPLVDFSNWLRRHQTVHNDQNEVLKISGSDLTGLDLESPEQVQAWIQLHVQEHLQANRELDL